MIAHDALVVGAGIFGLTTALELQQRGYRTALLDPGPVPHPLAASTDISKVVRMEYGSDEQYMAMMEDAFVGWRRWNERWEEPLYHETGVTMLAQEPMAPGGYEHESYQLLHQRGHAPERLNAKAIAQRFPAWNSGLYVDGHYHQQGGYAESGRVVAALSTQAHKQGITIVAGQKAQAVLASEGHAVGVRTAEGTTHRAGHVVIAAGTWTPWLIPELAPFMKSTGHPVFHLRVEDPTCFSPPHFLVFMADVASTGWYGFPIHPREGVLKIANHGVGLRLHPDEDERIVTKADATRLRGFLASSLPDLYEAPIVYTRRCLYCDTLDEHFWIDRHPDMKDLTIATGGSGHGFKFAPVLGPLVADAVEGLPNPWLAKFRWRDLAPGTHGEEAARHHT